MKIKIALFSLSCLLGFSVAFACGTSECGGGKTKCCKDAFGGMYYCTPKTGK